MCQVGILTPMEQMNDGRFDLASDVSSVALCSWSPAHDRAALIFSERRLGRVDDGNFGWPISNRSAEVWVKISRKSAGVTGGAVGLGN